LTFLDSETRQVVLRLELKCAKYLVLVCCRVLLAVLVRIPSSSCQLVMTVLAFKLTRCNDRGTPKKIDEIDITIFHQQLLNAQAVVTANLKCNG